MATILNSIAILMIVLMMRKNRNTVEQHLQEVDREIELIHESMKRDTELLKQTAAKIKIEKEIGNE